MKIKIEKIKTTYSENSELSYREFSTALEFDIAVMKAVAHESVTDLSYYKTDVTIVWADEETFNFTLEANRHTTFSSHFNALSRYYNPNKTNEFMTRKQWLLKCKNWKEFVEEYEL